MSARRRSGSAGLESYLEVLELRPRSAPSDRIPGSSAGSGRRRRRAASASGPCSSSWRRRRRAARHERPLAGGAAVELVHMATLVHDDLLDGGLRRGHETVWSAHGEEAARAAGDYLFARAFAELSAAVTRARCRLAGAALTSAASTPASTGLSGRHVRRGLPPLLAQDREALRGQVRACSGAGAAWATSAWRFGIAFQIADDILDCTGTPGTTGKAPGVDLRTDADAAADPGSPR